MGAIRSGSATSVDRYVPETVEEAIGFIARSWNVPADWLLRAATKFGQLSKDHGVETLFEIHAHADRLRFGVNHPHRAFLLETPYNQHLVKLVIREGPDPAVWGTVQTFPKDFSWRQKHQPNELRTNNVRHFPRRDPR